MKVALEVYKKVDIKYLSAKCKVRYWEDSDVNGVQDKNGDLIPCREGEFWKPLIDVEKGVIVNWEKGKKAYIHYKVCDAGTYALLDENMNKITEINGYVPSIMCPEDNGYGDYVIMDVDEEGKIDRWNRYSSFSQFYIYL